MGLLVEGVWQDDVSRTKDGQFHRAATQSAIGLRRTGAPGFPVKPATPRSSGRDHLCFTRLPMGTPHHYFPELKALENVISLSIVSPNMGREGWTFNKSEGSTGDEINGKGKLSEIYLLANPRYSGRVSVPVLWDKKRKTIVNNEFKRKSSECSILGV